MKHSFLVIEDQIIALSGKGIYLGEGQEGKVKLAENETGNLYALKITDRDKKRESYIANDLGIAGKCTLRKNNAFDQQKYYILYQYLGIPLSKYIREHKDLNGDRTSVGGMLMIY